MSFAGERSGGAVAGDFGLAELSTQSVHPCELPGVLVRRTASEPRSVRPAQRTAVRGVCSRRPCQRGAPRCRQRACLAGPAGASRAALRQGVEARAGERSEAQEELSVTRATARQISFADIELMRQGVRLEPLLETISKFLDSQHEMIERVRRDLVRDLKKPRKGRRGLTAPQVLRSLVVMRVKNWDYRELRERIADGVTLRQFTDFYCDPVN